MNLYAPQPIDTTHIALPPDIVELQEKLAKNAHEVWAQKRMEQGWTHGPERNDADKKHPSLIAYEELSEAEKDLDRVMVQDTLKLILALGYRIERPDPSRKPRRGKNK